jgi:hypothetical protein
VGGLGVGLAARDEREPIHARNATVIVQTLPV